ncbi:MAG: fibronectin type III domain-containing protein, partial [Gammaproteobacteria bacterium]|nr:fibronectin type III domain-containing protein [Gammaproteobacteria bacterium]
MNNSPADVARVGDRINPLNRVLRGCLRLLAPVLAAGGMLTATQVAGQPLDCTNDSAGRPTVFFTQRDRTITEGETADFRVVRTFGAGTTAYSGALTVNLDTSASQGDFASAALPSTVEFAANVRTAEFTIDTDDDAVDEPDGSIDIAITPDYPTYCDAQTADGKAAAYAVLDNDEGAPTGTTVTIAAGTSPVDEGAAAEFTLTRSATSGTLTVNVTVMESGDMIDGTAPATVMFADGDATAALSVATENDGVDEPDSVVTATVAAGTDYAPGTPDSAMVTVADDDEPPAPGVVTVTIALVASPVDEGTAAEFTLTRSDSAGALTVNVGVMESGNMIDGTAPASVEFADGDATAMLMVATENDDMDEPNSVVTATVMAGPGYAPGSPDSAMVTVNDDDDPVIAPAGVTIAADMPAGGFRLGLEEGGTASFTLTRAEATAALTVQVDVMETGDMISSAPTMVEFQAGDLTAQLMVETADDDVEEPNSYITATVVAGTDYAVGDPNSAVLRVNDNEGFVVINDIWVSVSGANRQVVEGADAVFTLHRNNAFRDDELTVTVEVEETGAVIANAPTTVDFAAGSTAATLTVTTTDDMAMEDDSVVTATVVAMAGYDVGARSSGSVTVTDNDGTDDGGVVTPPVDPDLPSVPRNLQAVPGDHQVTLSWLPPDSGGDATGYQVSVDAGDWMDIPGGAAARRHTIDDLMNGRFRGDGTIAGPSYSFEVRAVNDAGEGDPAGPVTATPLGPDIEISIMADAATATEGEDVVFTLERIFNPVGGDDGGRQVDTTLSVTVMVSVMESGATVSQAPMTVEFAAGQAVATLTVTTDDDMLDEVDSTVTATVIDENAPGYRPGATDSASTDVMDNDYPPTATISDAMAMKESGEIMFTISLDNSSGREITIDWTTGDDADAGMYDMAVADTDYMASKGSVVFMPADPAASGQTGETEHTITVPIMSDMLDERDETFAVSISTQMSDYVTIADGEMGIGTIEDDDAAPSVMIADMSAAEDDAGITFTVTLDAPSGLPIVLDWMTQDEATPNDMYGMATADVDYTAVSDGMVEFVPAAAGMAGPTTMEITVAVEADMLDEHDEVFGVMLMPQMPDYVMVGDGMAVGTIMDDDDAPMVSIADDSGPEADGGLTFAVTLDAPSALPISVAWATGDMETPDDMYGMATADVDYASASGTVEFAPGETEMSVDVMVMEDALDEHDEVFAVNLGEAMYTTVDDGMAVGTIEDDDDAPMVSVADSSASEGAGPLVFTVSLDAPSGLPSSVDWATGDITVPEGSYTMAQADVDYMSAGGTVDFPAGETEMTVEIELMDDAIDEKDELFAIVLTNPMYSVFGGDAEAVTATGTIMDDDDAPSVSIADASAMEASGEVTFAVTLDAPSGLPISADWATGDMATPDDMYGMATADVDYMSANGTSEFAPGDTEMMVTVMIMDDALDEHDEVFGVTLSNPMYVMVGDGEATGTIEDDDAAPTMSIADASGPESAGSLVFDVTLSAPSGLPIMADYATADGTAMAGEDYAATMGTLNIEPGGTSATVEVPIMDDDYYESAEETFHVNLSGAMYATLDDGSAVGTITNEDDPPTLAIGDSGATESAGQMTFEITKSGNTRLDATVDWATSDGTARAGEDYANSSGSVTFAPGSTSMSITVAIMADDRYEGEENFTVTLSGSMMSTLDDASATGTITDDDAEAVVQAWLARFGRTVATHVVDAVGGRLTGEPVEASTAQLRLGGYEVGATDAVWGGPTRLSMAGQRPGATGDPLFNPVVDRGFNPGFDPAFGQAWGGASQGPWVGTRNNSFGNLLSRSSFHFSAAGSNPGDSFALWGRGAMTSFSGDDGSLSHDGDVTTGTVGVDFETGQTLFGIGMSHSQGDGEFSGSASGLAGGNLDSTLTLFHPYVRVNINECTSIWGLVGTGSGDLTLTNGAGGAAIDTDIEMTMGAAGFRGPLQAGLGDFGLEVKSDVFLASMSADSAPGLDSVDAEASRARVALQGSNTTELEGGGLFTPTFEAGLRYDGGDAENGAGVEIGGGLRFADASRRVSLQLNARALLAHSESEYEEWGLGASVVVHPNASGQGVTFNVRTAWGEVASGVDAMWSRYDAAALVNRGERALARRVGARYDAELGYGLNAPGGRNVLVPYVAAGVSDIGTRDYRLGLRLRSNANMDLRFEVDRREGLGFEPDHGVVLRGWLFWYD